MAPVLLYTHPLFRKHRTGPGHPECPQRLEAIERGIEERGLRDRCRVLAPRAATEEELCYVHAPAHVSYVKECGAKTPFRIDAETVMSKETWNAALLASGALLDACDRILAGEDRRALCLVRPPGHHATPDRAMGFCLFNNVAIAAEHLKRRHGLSRILVADFDVHHGNGTQEIFWRDPAVLYVSSHRFPFYPGTGWPSEEGEGPGKGFNWNLPFHGDAPGDDVAAAWEEVLERASRDYRPGFVLVSAGFDGWRNDPIGGLNLEEAHFRRITRAISRAADATAGGRIVSALEGGYDLSALGALAAAHLEELM